MAEVPPSSTAEHDRSAQPLPAAMQSDFHDDGLVRAMTPVTEGAIRRSVELNPQIMAEALFPILGSAIRKMIAHSLEGMMQTLNAAMENSFSPQSIKWRLEAMRTGKSFADVVVIRTLVFRVEQVFLIERNGGTLLQHVAVDPKLAENSELVSAMLTAIQDFVRDSFNTPTNEGIGSVTVGDFALWIETGPEAVVAAVVRGMPPHDLRDVLHDTLVAIHREHLKPLTSFSGDPEIFAPTRELLTGCLREQRLPKAAPAPPAAKPTRRFGPLHAAALLGVVALGTWAGFAWRDAERWREFRSHVRHLPGIVLFHPEKRNGNYYLEGLCDPLAEDPLPAAARFKISADEIRARWTPFHSLDPRIVTRRARQEAAEVIARIEAAAIQPTADAEQLNPETQGRLARVAADVAQLQRLSPQADRVWRLQILSDEPNGETTSQVTAFLQRAGITERFLEPVSFAHLTTNTVHFRVVQTERD